MNLNMIIILSNIFSSSSSVASLFPARSFESTYFATESKSKLVNFCLDPTSFKFSNKPSIIGGKSFMSWPMSSAGLFGRLLIKVSKASFMPLTNFSFFMKHTSMMWSTLSLKSKSSWTIVLSFSGLMTIVLPKAWDTTNKTCDIECAHSERLWCSLSHPDGFPAHLDVLDPVLQKHLHASPHTIEELVQQRQILNTVLIQQVIQTYSVTRKQALM